MISPAVPETFSAPYIFRLDGALRALAMDSAQALLAGVLGAKLKLRHDFDLGGAHYAYEAHPTQSGAGLASAIIHAGDGVGTAPFGCAAESIIRVGWFGSEWLDLGRLEWALRQTFGDLFTLAEYSVSASALTPATPVPIHWVVFEAKPEGRPAPAQGAPLLGCQLAFDVEPAKANIVKRALAESSDSAAQAVVVSGSPTVASALEVEFQSASLLELGRFGELVRVASGGSGRITRYAVDGDLERDGRVQRFERFFTREPMAPAWRSLGDG